MNASIYLLQLPLAYWVESSNKYGELPCFLESNDSSMMLYKIIENALIKMHKVFFHAVWSLDTKVRERIHIHTSTQNNLELHIRKYVDETSKCGCIRETFMYSYILHTNELWALWHRVIDIQQPNKRSTNPLSEDELRPKIIFAQIIDISCPCVDCLLWTSSVQLLPF